MRKHSLGVWRVNKHVCSKPVVPGQGRCLEHVAEGWEMSAHPDHLIDAQKAAILETTSTQLRARKTQNKEDLEELNAQVKDTHTHLRARTEA